MIAERTVTIEHQPSAPKLDHIPAEVREHFAAKGKALHLGSADPSAVHMAAGRHRFPVTKEDLSEELVASLRRFAFTLDADGAVRRADCYLYQQSEEQREAYREEAKRRWAHMTDSHYGEVDQMNEQLRRSTGIARSRVTREDDGGLSGHVSRGQLARGE